MSPRSPAAPRHWSAANTAEIEGILARERIEFVHVGIFDTEGAFR